MTTETDILLKSLIESNLKTNESMQSLTESVNKLVVIDAARIEREKHQEKENTKVANFMIANSEPLARLKRAQKRYDTWGDKIGFIIIIAIASALGFNFLQ